MTTATAPNPSFADPLAPHDDLSFEALRDGYNFHLTSHPGRVLTRLIIKELQKREKPVRVLDVGCGEGIGRYIDLQWAIREHVDDFWGVEPDANAKPPEGLYDHHQTALMEDADLPADSFDLAYSAMVMEHVADPGAFMRAIHRCLKPGGVYIFSTPNGRHYFTRIANTLRKLRLDETVLRLVRGGDTVEDYHYPTVYAFNFERQIAGCVEPIGFRPPEFAYLEGRGTRGYFPKPLRFVYHALAAKRKVFRNPRNLLTLVGRITKS